MISNKILEYLEQLDLSETEAQLYLKLLETGPISVRDLAQTTGLKRTTAYLHVDLLVEKGLVMKIVKGSQKQVAANPPGESVEFLVKNKLEKAITMNSQFPTMLQELTEAIPEGKDVGSAQIKYYKGKSGIKKIYEGALKAGQLRTYVNIELSIKFLPDNGELFIQALKNSHIEIFEIISESNKSLEELSRYNEFPNYHYKILPKNIILSAANTLLYDDNVSIINAGTCPTGVVLKDNDYFTNSKELFDFVWQILPDIK